MKAAVQAQLTANLKVLKLSAFLSHLEVQLRQARESKEDYADFLLALSELEVAARMENGCKTPHPRCPLPAAQAHRDFPV